MIKNKIKVENRNKIVWRTSSRVSLYKHFKQHVQYWTHSPALWMKEPLLIVLTAFFQIRLFQLLKFKPLKSSLKFSFFTYSFHSIYDIAKATVLLTIPLIFPYFRLSFAFTLIVKKKKRFINFLIRLKCPSHSEHYCHIYLSVVT